MVEKFAFEALDQVGELDHTLVNIHVQARVGQYEVSIDEAVFERQGVGYDHRHTVPIIVDNLLVRHESGPLIRGVLDAD